MICFFQKLISLKPAKATPTSAIGFIEALCLQRNHSFCHI
jgi:hypothetical protein